MGKGQKSKGHWGKVGIGDKGPEHWVRGPEGLERARGKED